MLVSMEVLLRRARTEGYGVGSFDVDNLETTLAILETAVEKRSPVIVAIGEGMRQDLVPLELLFSNAARLSEQVDVPVAVLLDHGHSLEWIVRAIRSGATSVMLDASIKPYEENVALTRQAVEVAHSVGVAVEAELGHVAQGADYARIDEDRRRLFTQPGQAADFVAKTGVDALAVAVGTAHGHYVGTPRLDFDLLAQIRETVPVPLVLHGGSSSGDENLRRAVQTGVTKVNIYTDMATAARDRIRETLAQDPEKVRFLQLLNAGKAAFKDVAAHYMDLFGSTGKA